MTYQIVLSALADDRRRLIFDSLRNAPKAVGELSEFHPVSRPAVSQHLKVLEGAGLVSARQSGTRRIYSVRREGLKPLQDYLESFWDDVLGSYAEFANNQSGGRNHND